MKAIVIKGPSIVDYEEVEVKKPQEGEALIKIESVGLCGTDYELYTNEMVYIQEGLCKLPMIPGHEWSGVIVEAGDNADGFKVGDKVSGECTVSCGKCSFCKKGQYDMCPNRTETGVLSRDGAFAEYITFPFSHLHKFDNIAFDEAALIEPTAVALQVVLRAHTKPMENVLVIGPGPIGLQAAQIVKKFFSPRHVILSGTRQERLDRAKGFDLDGYINVKEEDLATRVREITNGEMIDTVIESSGGLSVFEDIEKVINPYGKVGMVGFFGLKQPPCNWDAFVTKNVTMYGSLGSPNVWPDVIKLMETGELTTDHLISHVMPLKSLEDYMKAMNTMVERRENVCKIIMKP